jgi:hypothetical protein
MNNIERAVNFLQEYSALTAKHKMFIDSPYGGFLVVYDTELKKELARIELDANNEKEDWKIAEAFE